MRSLTFVCVALLCAALMLPASHEARAQVRALGPARPPAANLEDLLTRAKAALDGGESRRSYEMLKREEARFIGNLDYDYMLGIAALDVGYPAEAVMHLERVLITKPDFLQARAEIAKAYLKLQETDNAKRELQTVADQEIPSEVRQVIGKYLDLIRRDEDAKKAASQLQWRGFVEAELGHDNNANYGTSWSTWLLADGTKVLPLTGSQPNSSALWGLSGGLEAVVPINGNVAWTTGLRLASRSYPSASTLSQSQADLSTGLRITTEKAQYNVLAQTQNLRLDGNAFRNAAGLAAQAQFELDEKNPGSRQWGMYAQVFDLSYPGAPYRNGTRLSGGLSWARTIDAKHGFLGLASLYGGRENTGLDTLSYSFSGLRGLLSRNLNADWTGLISASFEHRSYDGFDSLFGAQRTDRQIDLRIGAERVLSKQWVLAQEVTWTRNRSSLQPNDYQRSQWRLSIRYKF